jgi:hypothetical protein
MVINRTSKVLDLASIHLSNKMKQIYSKRNHATSQAFSALPTSFTDNSSKLQRVATRAHTILKHGSLFVCGLPPLDV